MDKAVPPPKTETPKTDGNKTANATKTTTPKTDTNGTTKTAAPTAKTTAPTTTTTKDPNATTIAATVTVTRKIAVTMTIDTGNLTMAAFVDQFKLTVETPAAVAFRNSLISGFRSTMGDDCPEATCKITITKLEAGTRRRELMTGLRRLASGSLVVDYSVETTADKSDAIATKMADPTTRTNLGNAVVAAVKANDTLKNDPNFASFAVTGVTAVVSEPVVVTTTSAPPAAAATEASSAFSNAVNAAVIAATLGSFLM